jgi:hypothetical protein
VDRARLGVNPTYLQARLESLYKTTTCNRIARHKGLRRPNQQHSNRVASEWQALTKVLTVESLFDG